MLEQFEKQSLQLCLDIEALRALDSGSTYLECIVEVCSKQDIDLDEVKNLLSKPIIDKMFAECAKNNLLKEKMNTLL